MASSVATRRPLVRALNGVVATADGLATAAGLEVLQRGGNAMDAAVAAALVTGVTLPQMCGLGGDAFILYYDAKSGEVTGINGSGIAARGCDADYFRAQGLDKVPYRGPHSVSVPGDVDALFAGLDRFGSLPVEELFAPAVRAAEQGFPITHGLANAIANAAQGLREWPTSAAVFLPNGRPLRPGEILRNPNLARTLRAVADGGSEAFYQGQIAREITSYLKQHGGFLSYEDFAEHQSDVYSPPSVDYRGYTVYQTQPPSQGHIMLEELNILENADLAALGHNSADAIHLMAETKKLAYADRLAYSGDPKFVRTPMDVLLSKSFARDRFQQIDMAQAHEQVGAGRIPERIGDTTYLCVIDRHGNGVSLIHSVSADFGSRVIAGDTGVVLNNRAGRGFTLEPGHPNVFAPGKRTMHTLNCYLVEQQGALRWVGGTPGGDGQPQWNMQALTNLIDYGQDEQEAVESPRWTSFPGTDPLSIANDLVLRVEERVGLDTVEALRQRGHKVMVLGAWDGDGAAQVIGRDPESGVLSGGSDPRVEGAALGY